MPVTREDILELIKKKEDIEQELTRLHDFLKAEKNVGMNEPLVDAENYPRSDIDVYQVRHARHRIICLQNDHKMLMKDIENKLHQLHAQQADGDGEDSEQRGSKQDGALKPGKPFVRVSVVERGSPAELAKLQEGDLITKFGTVTCSNFTKLDDIAVVVRHSVGRTIHVEVLRGSATHQLSLVPKPWGSRGLLGCLLVPVTSG